MLPAMIGVCHYSRVARAPTVSPEDSMSDDANAKLVPEVADLLDRLDDLGRSQDHVTLAEIQKCLGRDAFGPTLLAVGLLALSPIGDIPGAPTIMSFGIVLVAGQMALGRNVLSLPRFLARRTIKASRLCKMVKVVRPGLRFLSYVIRSRISFLTRGAFERAIAVICALLALTLPPLEFVPFGATVPSSLITGFALAIVTRDGLLALVIAALLIAAGYYAITHFA
ncbi:MAG: putative ABC transporter permease component [Erythrobacteraceae bacterium HL-111]|nr:MAG: putative ABC transporter permease component [Erythrobacteraceae bacterium HL-111]